MRGEGERQRGGGVTYKRGGTLQFRDGPLTPRTSGCPSVSYDIKPVFLSQNKRIYLRSDVARKLLRRNKNLQDVSPVLKS